MACVMLLLEGGSTAVRVRSLQVHCKTARRHDLHSPQVCALMPVLPSRPLPYECINYQMQHKAFGCCHISPASTMMVLEERNLCGRTAFCGREDGSVFFV